MKWRLPGQQPGRWYAQAQLQDFTGTLLTDGYAAYTKTVEQLNQYEQQIVHAACWVHMRRGFEKALDSGRKPHSRHWILSLRSTDMKKHIRHKQVPLPISMLTGNNTANP